VFATPSFCAALKSPAEVSGKAVMQVAEAPLWGGGVGI